MVALRLGEHIVARHIVGTSALEPLHMPLLLEDGHDSRARIDSPDGRRALSSRLHNLPSQSRCELDPPGVPTREVTVLPPHPDEFADADAGPDEERRYDLVAGRLTLTIGFERRTPSATAGLSAPARGARRSDRVGRRRSAAPGPTLLAEPALPGDEHLGRRSRTSCRQPTAARTHRR